MDKCCQWGLHYIPGKAVSDCSQYKKFPSNIKMKPLPVQPVPIASCSLYVGSCEERACALLVAGV